MAVRTENKPEMQGQLFLVQLKPISIIMCVQSTMRGLDEDMPGADSRENSTFRGAGTHIHREQIDRCLTS